VPLLALRTSAAAPKRAAYTRLTRLLARELRKSERWVMITVEARVPMTFGGSASPACYAELKNVGKLGRKRVEQLSALLCAEIARALGVARDRIYIEFTNAEGALWGWDGGTFA
jgi:hypothetical protein